MYGEASTLQELKKKSRGIADIVFCIDTSGSMTPCIEGVKNHIRSFINGLQSNPNHSVDCRLGILAHDQDQFDIKDFTSDEIDFSKSLSKISTRGDEYTLPAIDWSFDFEWRSGAHRIVIAFTDEPLNSGHRPDFQSNQLNELLSKAVGMKIMVYFVGPECEEYRQFNKVPRSVFEPLEGQSFENVNFQAVLTRIGKTVSESIGQQKGGGSQYQKDIYNIKKTIRINRI